MRFSKIKNQTRIYISQIRDPVIMAYYPSEVAHGVEI